jgi:hypothetical protein
MEVVLAVHSLKAKVKQNLFATGLGYCKKYNNISRTMWLDSRKIGAGIRLNGNDQFNEYVCEYGNRFLVADIVLECKCNDDEENNEVLKGKMLKVHTLLESILL